MLVATPRTISDFKSIEELSCSESSFLIASYSILAPIKQSRMQDIIPLNWFTKDAKLPATIYPIIGIIN